MKNVLILRQLSTWVTVDENAAIVSRAGRFTPKAQFARDLEQAGYSLIDEKSRLAATISDKFLLGAFH